MTPSTPYPIDLDALPAWAQQQRAAFEVLRYQLEDDPLLTDAEIDAAVDAVAAPIVAAIDCTQCANCCRTLHVYLAPQDVARLAAGLGATTEAVDAAYVEHAQAAKVGEWGAFAQRPCAFLCGRKCGVYAHRPDPCRAYPQFTPDFRWVLDDLIEGASVCPIIYHTLVAMTARIDAIQRGEA